MTLPTSGAAIGSRSFRVARDPIRAALQRVGDNRSKCPLTAEVQLPITPSSDRNRPHLTNGDATGWSLSISRVTVQRSNQFLEGLSIWSITNTSTGPFAGTSFKPSCS